MDTYEVTRIDCQTSPVGLRLQFKSEMHTRPALTSGPICGRRCHKMHISTCTAGHVLPIEHCLKVIASWLQRAVEARQGTRAGDHQRLAGGALLAAEEMNE